MAIRMTFTFYGDTQLDRTLTRFHDNIEDATPLWEDLANRFARLERKQFSSQGSASGGWAPLSPRYAAWKARHYPGKKILERTGLLKESLTQRPFGIEAIERQFMVIGSAVDYGLYHQQGGRNLPQRRPVEFTEATRRDWVKRLQRFIVTGNT